MERFVNGVAAQFNALAHMLEDGLCHIFHDCKLPAGTTPETTRVGFEKAAAGGYKVMVDYGITTDVENPAFRTLLEAGEANFRSIDAMRQFFNGFSSLFNPTPTSGEAEAIANLDRVEQLSREKKQQQKHVAPDKIAGKLKDRIVGQDAAIDKIAHEISAHLMSPAERPLVLALLGPCGVGKSETAKSLAAILSELSGVQYGFINDSGNTLRADHSVQKYLGAPPSYIGHGEPTVLDPVRKNPHHVIVIDEIEKAHSDLLIALMDALDTGYLSMNDNSPKIDLRSAIIIFTSNLPVAMEKYNALQDDFQRTAYCRDRFTEFTGKPEIARRISEFVVFNKLSERAKLKIILRYLESELSNYGAELRAVDDRLMLSFLDLNSKYGASELRAYVKKAISYKLAESGDEAFKGKKVKLSGTYQDVLIEEA